MNVYEIYISLKLDKNVYGDRNYSEAGIFTFLLS